MKAYRRSKGMAPLILNVSSRWKCVVNVTSWPLSPSEKDPGTRWIGEWVGLMAGLDVSETRNVKSLSKRYTLDNAHHYWIFVVGSVVQ
jgi:hypothetical protein